MSSSFPGRIIFFNVSLILFYSSSNVTTIHAKILRDNFIKHLHTKKCVMPKPILFFSFSHAWICDLLFCGLSLSHYLIFFRARLRNDCYVWQSTETKIFHFNIYESDILLSRWIYIKIFPLRWFFFMEQLI